jgi:hypothetical protein
MPAGTAAPAPVSPRPGWGFGGGTRSLIGSKGTRRGRQLAVEAGGAAALLRRRHGGVEVLRPTRGKADGR